MCAFVELRSACLHFVSLSLSEIKRTFAVFGQLDGFFKFLLFQVSAARSNEINKALMHPRKRCVNSDKTDPTKNVKGCIVPLDKIVFHDVLASLWNIYAFWTSNYFIHSLQRENSSSIKEILTWSLKARFEKRVLTI